MEQMALASRVECFFIHVMKRGQCEAKCVESVLLRADSTGTDVATKYNCIKYDSNVV